MLGKVRKIWQEGRGGRGDWMRKEEREQLNVLVGLVREPSYTSQNGGRRGEENDEEKRLEKGVKG